MKRARTLTLLVLSALAAACSGGDEKPGAILRGPGALAVFDGIVAHESGSIRPYLAVANERGDELRLIDTTDNEIVESPGIIFPLSVPFQGRPLWLASVDLGDGAVVGTVRNTHDLPDALVVVAGGSSVVELIDTWSGYPQPLLTPAGVPVQVDLGALAPGAEILSITGAAVPALVDDGTAAPGVGRILVGLSGGRLAVLDFRRDPADLTLKAIGAPTVTVLTGLGFDPVSLSQGRDARFVYAASRTRLPDGALGVAELKLPSVPAGPADWTRRELDARVPTEAVAAVSLGAWDPALDNFGATVPRVFALPDPSECGASSIPCGLLALDPSLAVPDPAIGHLLGNVVPLLDRVPGEGAYLLPIDFPAPAVSLLAVGRDAASALQLTSGAGTKPTTGVAVVTATDGRAYLVDLARWAMASETSPLVGAGKTGVRAAAATVVDATASAIALWSLDHVTLSALTADLLSSVRVTPGFTPDDEWALTWKGVLPALDGRAALLYWDGSVLSLAVQVGATNPVASANLGDASLGVVPNQTTIELSSTGSCLDGSKPVVEALLPADADRPGGRAQLTPPACLVGTPAFGAPLPGAAVFRASGLVLVGSKSGYAGRPALDAEHVVDSTVFPGRFQRLFYVTDPCTDATRCDASWMAPPLSLGFPFPDGPALGLIAGFVDASNQPTTAEPPEGTALRLTTASGLVRSGRHPIDDGTALASSLPSGLAIDPVVSGDPTVWVSYTAGLVVRFSTGGATGSMSVIR